MSAAHRAAPGKRAPPGLLRVLGRVFAVAVAVGSVMGGGILYTPGKIAALLPDPWLYMGIWVLGGVNALLGATMYAEVGAMVQMSGGPYPAARRALGEYAGFLVGYTQWALDCVADAALLLIVGDYTCALVPGLAGRATAVAFAALVFLTLLNWSGVRQGGRLQIATTVAKTLALGGVAVAAFVLPVPALAPAAAPAVPHGLALASALLLAMQGVIFTYDSFYVPIFFGEELKDPGREIPRAIFRGLAIVIPVYLLLNFAFLHVLSIRGLANDSFAGGSVAKALFGALGDPIIRVIVIVSVLGTLNGIIMMTARVLYAMARDGLFAHQAARVNAGGTPTTALLLSSTVTAAFLFSGAVNVVLSVSALLMAVNYLLMYGSFVALRVREPDAPRPYRAFGAPYTSVLGIVLGLTFVVGVALSDPLNGALAFGVLLASYPLYRLTRRLVART